MLQAAAAGGYAGVIPPIILMSFCGVTVTANKLANLPNSSAVFVLFRMNSGPCLKTRINTAEEHTAVYHTAQTCFWGKQQQMRFRGTAGTGVARAAHVRLARRPFSTSAAPEAEEVELVYFDILARGELVRLCYAAHAAGAGTETFVDTRLPFFMDSAVNQELSDEVHRPSSPFAFFPYLNVRDREAGSVQTLSGDGVIEGFVGRRLGLAGQGELQDAICLTVAHNAVMLAAPPLTGAGVRFLVHFLLGSSDHFPTEFGGSFDAATRRQRLDCTQCPARQIDRQDPFAAGAVYPRPRQCG